MPGGGMESLGRTLALLGVVLVIVGVVLYFGGKYIPFGRLPGDFHFERDNYSFSFPLMTSLVLSVVLTLILNLFFFRR